MSFADEVKSIVNSIEYKGTEQFNSVAPSAPAISTELSPGNAPVVPVEASAPNAKASPEPAKEQPVRIGDKEFKSIQEAYIFAREEAAKAQGKLDAISQLNQAPPVQAEEVEAWESKMEKLMFTNPAEAIKQINQKATADALTQLAQAQAKEREIANRNVQYETYMTEFLTENADLADFRSIIENVVLADQPFWNSVKDLPLSDAKTLIAARTRSLLKIKASAEAKTTVMTPGHANIPGATGAPSSVTPVVTSNVPMDFITQIRKANKRSK